MKSRRFPRPREDFVHRQPRPGRLGEGNLSNYSRFWPKTLVKCGQTASPKTDRDEV